MNRRLHAGLCMAAVGGLLIASLGATAAVAADKPGDDVLSALAATAQTDEAPGSVFSLATQSSRGRTHDGAYFRVSVRTEVAPSPPRRSIETYAARGEKGGSSVRSLSYRNVADVP